MQYTKLGSSGIDVSVICLGTMTWGVQNDQQDANEQIDNALAQGVNFLDTAEMYAIPSTPETYGKTEEILGNWLVNNKEKRSDLVVATKIAGSGLPWIRDGAEITGKSVLEAVDASLERMQTDYIDLYQLHWPNRNTPHFSQHWPGMVKFSEMDRQKQSDDMLDILQALSTCMKAGKIRHFGLSDDTTWGINEYIRLSDKHGLPRPVSIQNEFSLVKAIDWPYLIENCIHEDIAYLPWSPLGTGMLSGKYLGGARPKGSRWTLEQRQGLFRDSELSNQAVSAYVDLAKQLGITPSQLALAWCSQVDGITSTIIGATTLSQLRENIEAFDIVLGDDALNAVIEILKKYPMPF
jgi:aryl-alcohol dehydrogenase-like predicted oxidoreductase